MQGHSLITNFRKSLVLALLVDGSTGANLPLFDGRGLAVGLDGVLSTARKLRRNKEGYVRLWTFDCIVFVGVLLLANIGAKGPNCQHLCCSRDRRAVECTGHD